MHKRQRRVGMPAFSIQNMRALIPVTFQKAVELRDRWMALIADAQAELEDEKWKGGARLDVCHWVSRATFDVIGLAGMSPFLSSIFDTDRLIQALTINSMRYMTNRTNSSWPTKRCLRSLFHNKEEASGNWSYCTSPSWTGSRYVMLCGGSLSANLLSLQPGDRFKVIRESHETIKRVAGRLIQEKKRKIEEAEKAGSVYGGKDLLSALRKRLTNSRPPASLTRSLVRSNVAVDLPPDQRISDEDILHNINTFMFAGSDTSSLSVTWILYLLSVYPAVQDRLRAELLSVAPTSLDSLTQDEIASLYAQVAELPYLENVVRETLRLIPPVHSSIRVATQDDVIPTATPVKLRTQYGDVEEANAFVMPKGSCVHVPIEAFNLDREVWGPDGWAFKCVFPPFLSLSHAFLHLRAQRDVRRVHVLTRRSQPRSVGPPPGRGQGAAGLVQQHPHVLRRPPGELRVAPCAVVCAPGTISILTMNVCAHAVLRRCDAQSCIGVKFSIIEIKMFMFVLVTHFKFAECDKVGKANV